MTIPFAATSAPRKRRIKSGELVERGMQFGQARAIGAFNHENCVAGIVGELGAAHRANGSIDIAAPSSS